MKISLIVSMSLNNTIGIKNTLPWNIPDDMKWFKKNTIYKPIIMGRKTFQSINKKFLPNRLNIVISNKNNKSHNKNIIFVNSKKKALFITKKYKEIMIIGGEKIYNLFMSKANRLYITQINDIIHGDTFFPNYKEKNWKIIFKKNHKKKDKHDYNYCFKILDKK